MELAVSGGSILVGSKMKTIAIIVAGGMGTRFSSNIPKQYTNNILKSSIVKFLNSSKIDAIQVVIRPEDQELYDEVASGFNLLPVIFGGATRSASVKNGMEAIEKYNPELVLIHDANRPYLSTNLIDEIVASLLMNKDGGVAPVLPITETTKRINGSNIENIERSNLFTMQTPQGFHFQQIFSVIKTNKLEFTDETSLAEHYNIQIKYIQGEKNNIKITTLKDIVMQQEIRTGMGFDAHKFSDEINADNFVMLGGIRIPHKHKIEAHSDGDVLIHALVDAILGSIACGDIGMHFPPSDSKWKNANSVDFLIHANKLLKEKNGHINNIDITVICEKPHLSKYKELMQNNLAKILSIEQNKVSVKATTTEKMGFTGRGEGIAVQAIATISINF